MSVIEGSVEMDALLAQGAWLRRLATALVIDPDEAEDLAQETWLVALRSPPRSATAVRLWLRRVLVSRIRDATRARQRRAARERAATDAEATATDPELLTARIELHRRIASHMASLEEPIRQVLFLRFAEGLEPAEVARRLGIPGGTARWRLKRGLDELRERLDVDSRGEREAWVSLLLPLVPPEAVVPPAGSPPEGKVLIRARPLRWWDTAAAKLALGALVVAVGVLGGSRACTNGGTHEANAAAGRLSAREDLDAAARRLAAQAQPRPPAPPPAVSPAPRSCPEARALEKERDALAAAAEPFRNPQVLFQQSPRNLEAERRLAPLVDEAFPSSRSCGHAFECRGQACRVELVVPESLAKQAPGPGACFEPKSRIAISDRVTVTRRGTDGGSAFDPVSRTWLRRHTIYVRLANKAGDPVPPERQKPPELPAGWDRDRGPLPAGLAPDCEAATLRVRRDIEALVRRIERDLPPRKVFAASAPNATLSGEIAGSLRTCVAPGEQDLPVSVECRGSLCALAPRAGDPGAAVRWQCPPDEVPRGACHGDPEGDWWFPRLLRCRDLRKLMEVVDAPRKREDGIELTSALVRMRPPEQRGGVRGDVVLFQLARERDFTDVVAQCEQRHPATGVLLITARVPDTCGGEDDPEPRQITVEYAGELLGSDLAACLAEKTKPVLDGFELPRCTYGWTGEFRLEFPNSKIEIPAENQP